MTATALIVARMGSTRLPGKSMMPILGEPMVGRLVDRVARAASVDRVVLATTELLEDAPLAELAEARGIECYRGDPEDVLARIHGAMVAFGGDPVLEILGDNPLVHSDLIDDVMGFYREGELDYASNATTEFDQAGIAVPKFPVGVRVEVIRAEVLERCHREATDPEDREHSALYIYSNPAQFRVGLLPAEGRWAGLNRPELTFAVNYPENFELVTRIFELCLPEDENFPLPAVLRVFEEHPELHALIGAPAHASSASGGGQ